MAEPVRYRLDPTHSFVYFEVVHFNASTLRGRFGPISGEVTLDREAGSGYVGLTIPTAGVSTGSPTLDERLRDADLLSTVEFPTAYFVAERFVFDAGALREVSGELTLRGTSVPLTLKAQRFRCYLNPLLRHQVCGGDFEAEMNRSWIGATYGLPFVADHVRLMVSVEAVKE
jgi:polyisoprenoid-binding protein YceI